MRINSNNPNVSLEQPGSPDVTHRNTTRTSESRKPVSASQSHRATLRPRPLHPPAPHTCESFDARALEQPGRAVLVVPVVSIPAVVDAVVVVLLLLLLLDLHVLQLRRHRRHVDLAVTPPPPPPGAAWLPFRLLAAEVISGRSRSLRPAVRGKAEGFGENLQRPRERRVSGN